MSLVYNHSNEGNNPYVGWSNAVNAQDYGAGVMVWLKNTGGASTASASFTFDHQSSRQFIGSQNADYDTCSHNMITDISTDRYGQPTSPSLSGYLCNLAGELTLWIPSTGEARLMSSYYQQNVGYMSVPTSPFSSTDAKSSSPQTVLTVTFIKRHYEILLVFICRIVLVSRRLSTPTI